MISELISAYKESLLTHSISRLRVISDIILGAGPSYKIGDDQSGCRFTASLFFTIIYINCIHPDIKSFITFYREIFNTSSEWGKLFYQGISKTNAPYTIFPSNINTHSKLTIVQILTTFPGFRSMYSPKHTFLVYKNGQDDYIIFSSWNPPLIELKVTHLSYEEVYDFIDDIKRNNNIYKQTEIFGNDIPITGDIHIACLTDEYVTSTYVNNVICETPGNMKRKRGPNNTKHNNTHSKKTSYNTTSKRRNTKVKYTHSKRRNPKGKYTHSKKTKSKK